MTSLARKYNCASRVRGVSEENFLMKDKSEDDYRISLDGY